MSVTSLSILSKPPGNRNGKIRKKRVKQLKRENLRRQMETLIGKLDRMVTCFGIDTRMHDSQTGRTTTATETGLVFESVWVALVIIDRFCSNSLFSGLSRYCS